MNTYLHGYYAGRRDALIAECRFEIRYRTARNTTEHISGLIRAARAYNHAALMYKQRARHESVRVAA